MQDKYEDLYTIAMLRYQEENANIDPSDLFPDGWHLNKDYKLKIMIIAEAIQNHVLVFDTELYKENFISGYERRINNN